MKTSNMNQSNKTNANLSTQSRARSIRLMEFVCVIVGLMSLVFFSAHCKTKESNKSVFIKPLAGEVAEITQRELSHLEYGQRLLVYVSADWCEPCNVFQSAVESGKLQKEMPFLRFLKFDADEDSERLERDGYGGRMIPRFVKPGEDGKGTDQRFEGSVKGPTAFANILPKLKTLLSEQ